MKNLIFSLILALFAGGFLLQPSISFAQTFESIGGGSDLITDTPTTIDFPGVNDDQGLIPNEPEPNPIQESLDNERIPTVLQVVPSLNTGPTSVTIFDQIVPKGLFGNSSSPLNTLLNQLFYIGLAAAVVLAIVMIVRGGIEYMTIDSMDSKNSGKKRVEAALGGLLLAFSAILILNTINPNITKLDLAFSRLQGIGSITVGGVLTPGTRPGGGGGYNSPITPTAEGFTATPGRVAIDTDGINPPPFRDPDYQSQTSLPGLDANVDNYVVVPIGSNIPLRTRVKMYNANTGITIWGVVGDRGPTANGLGELSLNAARELGAWTSGMGNSAKQHSITYTFYTNE